VQHLTREQILARKVGHGVAELPGGGTVAIRALTRDEVLEMQQLEGASLADRDNFLCSKGMTDPVMSVEDVAAWAAAGAAGDIVAITEAVARLSGLAEGAGKSSPA
jgi:hypothetical protein